MPNTLAYVALALWPVVGIVLFNRLPAGRALLANLLIAYLFLPPGPAMFNFPLLPALTKETIPSLVALLTCLVLWRDRIHLVPDGPLARALAAVFVFGPLVTILNNLDPVHFGTFSLPGLRLVDFLSIVGQQTLLLIPFILASSLMRTAQDLRDLMAAFLIAGLVYSLPMLLEVRLSPQLNIWVYGFFQHDFSQAIRQGGFRPFVFLYHGIWVALFALMSLVAAVALLRADQSRRVVALALAAVYLFAVLVLCKTAAALLYALLLVPLVLLASQRLQITVAVLIATLALAYPAAKGLDLVPHDRLLALAESYDPDRAASLEYRFNNEIILLERAAEKPLFGWGTWGRNHVFSAHNGELLTTTDGRWIILIGVFGWLGFLAEFGLLTLPIFLLWARSFGHGVTLSPFAGPAALLLAINIFDLIPNATLTPLTWLFAGALLGYAQSLSPMPLQREPVFRTII
jgi:hypothetical protein